MSDQENFLTRWSRRKREPADENVQAGKPAVQDDDAQKPAAAPAPDADAPPEQEFDLTKLPSIESIGANSDISAFLQPGVPSALRHAALRRAWAADPAIRDFVGLAEYAWDFTAPDSMPGFGEIGPDVDIKKLVAEIFGEAGPATEPEAKSRAASAISAPAPEQPAQLPDKSDTTAGVPAASETLRTAPQVAASKSDALLQRDENIAMQQDDLTEQPAAGKAKRHGSAMPQ